MTNGEAIKSLIKKGWRQLNHKGSHVKFGKDEQRITVVVHAGLKESMCPKAIKEVRQALATG